jgi:ribonuclease BN (tRNA processing enzyme)
MRKKEDNDMQQPYLRPLGSADWQQSKGNDHSCYTVGDRILIDANSALVMNLLNLDLDPISMDTLCFTHMHADHVMGLAPLLLLWRVRRGGLEGLTILGPKQSVREAVEYALRFALHDGGNRSSPIRSLPTIVELSSGDRYDHPDYRIAVTASDHAVPGLCYRFEHRASGHVLGLSGDTRCQPGYADFFRDADLLVYEASYGAGPLDAFNETCRHSSAREAAQVCAESGAKRLMLTHCYEAKRAQALEEARRRLSVPVLWATPGECFAF